MFFFRFVSYLLVKTFNRNNNNNSIIIKKNYRKYENVEYDDGKKVQLIYVYMFVSFVFFSFLFIYLIYVCGFCWAFVFVCMFKITMIVKHILIETSSVALSTDKYSVVVSFVCLVYCGEGPNRMPNQTLTTIIHVELVMVIMFCKL